MFKKKDIIKKLQEWSAEHGGKTPGESRFFEDTEVGITDRSKYWINWGELVKDAGLTPNKFDKTKYTEDQLCELFIETIRENGKWPTRGILHVKHHSKPSFPDSATFYYKLGLTENLAKKIIVFTKNKKNYKDVIDICNSVVERYGKEKNQSENLDKTSNHGWVYLLKTTFRGKDGYKIGNTNDLKRREKELNQPSNDQSILHAIETDDPFGVEKYWHTRFESKLYKNNEWFLLNRSDIRAFKRWKRIF